MADTVSDYRTDQAYPAHFHKEYAPLWLRSVLAALGVAGPERIARICEIGCGQGFGLLALAAANPGVAFSGIDLNPDHIETARSLAREAGLENIRFDCADIRAVAENPGADQAFDLILSHGVYSWVDDAARAAIRRFAAAALAPGGLFYLHYMTLPGCAPMQALHAVFSAIPAGEDRVSGGLARLRALEKAKSGFFALHPHIETTLAALEQRDAAYTAHDFVNTHFAPLAVGGVMRDMRDAGLERIGSAIPLDNIDVLSLPGSTRPIIAAERDPVLRETLKDMARNQSLRCDLYMRAPQYLDIAAHGAALRAQRFALMPGAPLSGPVKFSAPTGPIEGPAEVFSPLLARLAAGAADYGELEAMPPFAGRPPLLNQALQMLLWAGIAHPVAAAVPEEGARRFNRLMLRRFAAGAVVPALAAPALGGALPLNPNTLTALADKAADTDYLAGVRRLCPL